MGESAILGELSPFEGLCYETFGTHLERKYYFLYAMQPFVLTWLCDDIM